MGVCCSICDGGFVLWNIRPVLKTTLSFALLVTGTATSTLQLLNNETLIQSPSGSPVAIWIVKTSEYFSFKIYDDLYIPVVNTEKAFCWVMFDIPSDNEP